MLSEYLWAGDVPEYRSVSSIAQLVEAAATFGLHTTALYGRPHSAGSRASREADDANERVRLVSVDILKVFARELGLQLEIPFGEEHGYQLPCPDEPSASARVPAGPDVQILGIGIGRIECDVTSKQSTFRTDDHIAAVASYDPPLEPGSKVTVTLERDGMELDFGGTIRATEPSPCATFDVGNLGPGRYRLVVAVEASAMPPMSGEFEVTP